MPPPTAASKRRTSRPSRGRARSSSGPVVGDDVLVRRDHAPARRQRGPDQRVGRLVAAHRLDDDVDVVARDAGATASSVSSPAGMPFAIARSVNFSAIADQHERPAVRRGEAGRPLEERADDLAADGAGADDADAQGLNAHSWGLGRWWANTGSCGRW